MSDKFDDNENENPKISLSFSFSSNGKNRPYCARAYAMELLELQLFIQPSVITEYLEYSICSDGEVAYGTPVQTVYWSTWYHDYRVELVFGGGYFALALAPTTGMHTVQEYTVLS